MCCVKAQYLDMADFTLDTDMEVPERIGGVSLDPVPLRYPGNIKNIVFHKTLERWFQYWSDPELRLQRLR